MSGPNELHQAAHLSTAQLLKCKVRHWKCRIEIVSEWMNSVLIQAITNVYTWDRCFMMPFVVAMATIDELGWMTCCPEQLVNFDQKKSSVVVGWD